jgi:hypothetical protein
MSILKINSIFQKAINLCGRSSDGECKAEYNSDES